jgi:peptide/nickel transport system permease protein
MMPALAGGAPVTETIFAWPGIGQLLVQSVIVGDYVLAMSVLMIIACLVVFFNLFADVAYGLLDPRIRYA